MPAHDASPICMPAIYIRDGKSVMYHSVDCVDATKVKAVERAKTLGLLGDIAVVALDREETTWTAVADILRSGMKLRLEGVETLDEALEFLDKGVSKIVLPAKTWEDEEARSIIGKYRDRFTALFSASKLEEDDELKTMTNLSKYVEEVLIEFKEFQGLDDEKSTFAAKLKKISNTAKQQKMIATVTGGIDDVKTLVMIDKVGLRPQIGDALVTGKLEIADLIIPFIRSDRHDKLYSTVVVDEQHVALGLVYSDEASVREATRKRAGIYYSRRRGLWHKGLTSGATQDLYEISLDCDRDALRYVVRQHGSGFCHLNRYTCWDSDRGIGHLFRTLLDRKQNPVQGSYTNKLLDKADMLNAKMLEEATEIIEAKEKNHVASEAADVLYFASVICTRSGVNWKDVENYLDRRSRRVRRRKGATKTYAIEMLRKATKNNEL